MKFLVITAVVLIALTAQTNGQKECKEFIKALLHKQLKTFFECKKSLNFKNEEDKLSKMNCILKCALSKEGLLTADGYVDEASALAYVEKEIPADIQPKFLELVTKCASHTDTLKPEEETCLSYNPLIKCAMGVLFKVCL